MQCHPKRTKDQLALFKTSNSKPKKKTRIPRNKQSSGTYSTAIMQREKNGDNTNLERQKKQTQTDSKKKKTTVSHQGKDTMGTWMTLGLFFVLLAAGWPEALLLAVASRNFRARPRISFSLEAMGLKASSAEEALTTGAAVVVGLTGSSWLSSVP